MTGLNPFRNLSFGLSGEDVDATCSAIHDFASFERRYREVYEDSRPRKHILQRLYRLYLAISKTRILFQIEHLKAFKDALPEFKNRNMTYFLNDLERLHAIGAIQVDNNVGKWWRTREREEKHMKKWGYDEETIARANKFYTDKIEAHLKSGPPPTWPNI
ncbi:MAG: hypothetical protein IKO64_03350 [Kiritimatiellae bacterium]|nr:hypothetical protein [Kiritimatiellia bacterium]